MKIAVTAFIFVLGQLLFSCSQQSAGPVGDDAPILINEFMASNQTDTILDEAGVAEDWIELYNQSDEPFNLKGLYLSDDSTALKKFALPDTLLPSKSHYLVWADKEKEEGPNHAGFKLSASQGEEIILTAEGSVIIDRIAFFENAPATQTNFSYGRREDGSAEWVTQAAPTPGRENIKQ